ncbi:S-adenosyl-L-methionine-dependent methyltransferase [Apiospora saccharicola]|uniref:S-adenosyl-L-methionine-dependent methyltransferase n=1 Tax=Apiospora saccharicola TaxID=335842 RepID=A0ABR1VKF6_9PEZI
MDRKPAAGKPCVSDHASTRTGSRSEPPPEDGNMLEARAQYLALRKELLPESDTQQRQARARHRVYTAVLDGNLTCCKLPSKVNRVLDIGSGIGCWAVDIARKHPEARVTCIDHHAVHLRDAPSNVSFRVADMNRDWPVEPNSLDLIHIRAMSDDVVSWPFILSQALKALRPGGQLEVSEIRPRFWDFDGLFSVTDVLPDGEKMAAELSAKIGVDLDPSASLPMWLDSAGFEKAAQRSEILPVGNWSKDAKLHHRATLYKDLLELSGWEGKSRQLFVSSGWDLPRYTSLVNRMKESITHSKIRVYMTAVFTICRRPADEQ